MFNKSLLKRITFLLILSSCGSSNSGPDTPAVTGVAAIGAPLGGARVTLIGQACSKIAQANSSGVFSVTLGTCTGPYLLRAEGQSGTVHSIATGAGATNITPITELVTARTLGTNSLFTATSISSSLVTSNLETAKSDVKLALQPLLTQVGVGSLDIMSGTFSADGTGIDKAIDAINIVKSGSNLNINLKGVSGSTITLPSSISTSVTGDISADVAAANTAMTEFNSIRSVITSMNTCMSTNSRSCMLNYVDTTNFKHKGKDFATTATSKDWWNNTLEISSTYYIKMTAPALITMNSANDEADIMLIYEEYTNGSKTSSYTEHMKFKKVSGSWKAYGNRLPYALGFSESVVLDQNGSRHRVYKAEGTDPTTNTSMSLTSTDLGITSKSLAFASAYSGTYKYINFDSTLVPSCATTTGSIYCKSYLKVADDKILPNFVKIQITIDDTDNSLDGTYSLYLAAVKSAPSSASDFPQFASNVTSSNLCGSLDTTTMPSALTFTVPTGQTVDGANIGPINSSSGASFNFSSYNTTAVKTNKSFPLVWTGSGATTINAFNASISSSDAYGLTYIKIFGCAV